MSRRKTFPSLSSSRQMMMAWKLSGLSHSPAILASRPASMRLKIAISPSRESSSTEPISRRYIRTGSSVRSVGSLIGLGRDLPLDLGQLAAFGFGLLLGPLALAPLLLARLLGLDDVDPHLAEHGDDILDLLGIDLLRGQNRVDLVMGDVAAFLGGADGFLTAASERSSSGNGVSGVSAASFSGASSFSFSFCAALVLLAIHLFRGRPSWDIDHHSTHTLCGESRPILPAIRGPRAIATSRAAAGSRPELLSPSPETSITRRCAL